MAMSPTNLKIAEENCGHELNKVKRLLYKTVAMDQVKFMIAL